MAIGLANLARTAGYRDPQRLQWAMEQQAVADLARGPVVLTRGELTLTLAVDADGAPSLSRREAGQADQDAARRAQEGRGGRGAQDPVAGAEATPVAGCAADWNTRCAGRPFGSATPRPRRPPPARAEAGAAGVRRRKAPRATSQTGGGRWWTTGARAIGATERLRIAHPHDLLALGDWAAWQRECYGAERVQPFKQVFRELYPSRNGAGHQSLAAVRRPPGEAAAGAGAARQARLGGAAGGGRAPDVPRRGTDGVARLPGGVLHAGRHRGTDARGRGVHAEGRGRRARARRRSRRGSSARRCATSTWW